MFESIVASGAVLLLLLAVIWSFIFLLKVVAPSPVYHIADRRYDKKLLQNYLDQYILIKDGEYTFIMDTGKYNRVVFMALGDDVSLMYYDGAHAQKGAMVTGEDAKTLRDLIDKYEKQAKEVT